MHLSSRHKIVINLVVLLTLFFGACNNSNKPLVSNSARCDSCCLTQLAHFVDTLNIDTSKKSFNYYFNDKQFSLGDCRLEKFRGNSSLKSSLVLFWLKIDNVYLKYHWDYNYSQDLARLSNAVNQLVHEFYFLATKKDEKIIEYFGPNWVNAIIEKDTGLLKNTQIKKLYFENKLLKKRAHK